MAQINFEVVSASQLPSSERSRRQLINPKLGNRLRGPRKLLLWIQSFFFDNCILFWSFAGHLMKMICNTYFPRLIVSLSLVELANQFERIIPCSLKCCSRESQFIKRSQNSTVRHRLFVHFLLYLQNS